jgi:hypothetical protein
VSANVAKTKELLAAGESFAPALNLSLTMKEFA